MGGRGGGLSFHYIDRRRAGDASGFAASGLGLELPGFNIMFHFLQSLGS